MQAKLIPAVIFIGILIIGAMYTNCSKNLNDDASGVVQSAPLPTFTIGCTTSECTSLSAGNYDVYAFYVATSSCSLTTAGSTVTAKAKGSGSATGSGLTTGLTAFTWANGASKINYGTYTEWAWVDKNSNAQLDLQEPYVCSVLTVNSPSIGNRSLESFSAATSNQPALIY